jgi:hypothetical protein
MPVTINGSNTPTAGGITYGDGTQYATTAAGFSGQLLRSNGASAPSWVTFSSTPTIVRSARTSNTILGTADASTLIEATANSYTQTITAAATLGSGWFCYVSNAGTGFITLDPNASETITVNGNALSTWILWPNEIGLLVCDGSGFFYYCIRYGFCTVTVSGTPSSVVFNSGIAYRTKLSLSWDNVTLSANDQVKFFMNATAPTNTSGIVYTDGTTVSSLIGSTDNFTLGVSANTTFINGSGTLNLSPTFSTFNGLNRYRNPSSQVVYGNYQSVFTATLTSVTSISIAPNTTTFASGTFILQQI